MNANELMIGNFVLKSGEIIELTSVNPDASMLQPSLLTDGWLLELGFTYSSEGKFFYENETIIEDMHGFYHSDYQTIPIKYVHQLQNLFTLLGKPLESAQP